MMSSWFLPVPVPHPGRPQLAAEIGYEETQTWQRKEGENSEGNHTQLGESVVHADDVHQDLLRDVRGPEHHEAKLDGGRKNKGGEIHNRSGPHYVALVLSLTGGC